MKPGEMILNRKLTTQKGDITAKPGHRLVSIFLGSVADGTDPEPANRIHNLGWRQMAFFEMSIRICTDREAAPREDFEWRFTYSCLGAVDAVEAAVRFANKAVADQLDRDPPGTPAPYIDMIKVGTIKVGPIDEEGTPYNGRGPCFFGWKKNCGVTLDDHLGTLRDAAERHAQ